MNNLNFDVQINADASMYVTETWDIDIEETNTLFKKISKTINKDEDDYLVAFNNYHDKVVYGDTLDIVINYIIENNLIDDKEPIIEETCVIENQVKHESKRM